MMLILTFFTAHAAEVKVPIAGQIGNLYAWALGIGGLVALGAIIFGGILYTISAGNASRQGDAKDWITGAIIGLILLFSSYLILNTINPELTKLKDLNLIVNEAGDSGGDGTGDDGGPPVSGGTSLREASIACNDYGACTVHTSGCALLNESGASCVNNVVPTGNCDTKLNPTLINNLLAAKSAGFNIYVASSVCSASHGQNSFHYRLLATDLSLPSSDEEVRRLMSFLNSMGCIHDLWGPSRFSGLCVDNGRKGVACSVPNHEDHLHYDVQPSCQ